MHKWVLICALLISFPAKADTKVSPTIAYGDDPRQIVQVYTPDQCRNVSCPVVLWVHGGGWKHGDMMQRASVPLMKGWAEKGIVMVGVNYRLSPAVVHPAHVEDVAAAINWTHKNISKYGGDGKRISLLGHSAGAQLVALVATNPTYLNAYGLKPSDLHNVFPIDTASFDLTKPSRFVAPMIVEAFGTDKQMLNDASPIYNVHKGERYPRFVMAAVKNRPDAVEASQTLQAKLKEAGGVAKVMVMDYPGLTQIKAHGEIARNLSDVNNEMTRTLISHVLDN